MKIHGLSWAGVTGLRDGKADFAGSAGLPADLVAVTGPPGSGKSRLLALIAHTKERLAPYGSPPADDLVTSGAAKVVMQWWLSESEQRLVGARDRLLQSEVLYPRPKGLAPLTDPSLIEILERYSHSPEIGKLDYVPPDRAKPTIAGASGDLVAEQKRKRLASGSGKYASIKQLAVQCMRARDPRVPELRGLFSDLCRTRRLGNPTADGDIDMLAPSGAHIPLRHASSSEWEAFAMAATVVLVGLQSSIVLYDTPELYIEGPDAAERLASLRRYAPTTQLIVATRSIPVLEMASVVVTLADAGR